MIRVLCVLVAAGRVSLAEPAPPRISIRAEKQVGLPEPDTSRDLLAELAATVRQSGCVVTNVCQGSQCPAGVGDATMFVSADFPPGELSCTGSVELRGPEGAVRFRQSLDKVSCPTTFFIRDAKAAAVTVCREVQRTALLVPPPHVEETRPAAPVPSKYEPGWVKPLGWAVVGAGTGAVIAGALLWNRNGQCSSKLDGACGATWDVSPILYGGLLVGGAAAAAGGAVILFRSHGEAVVASLGWRSIAFAGRF